MMLASDEFAVEFPDEGQHVEFKSGLGRGPIQEAAVAFSNADGGVILFGVADDGAVRGATLTDEAQLRIHQAIAATSNPGRYEISDMRVDDREIIVVAIHRRQEGFAQTSNGRPLIRRGKENVPLVGDELFTFAAQRAHRRYETTRTDTPLVHSSPKRMDHVRRVLGLADTESATAHLAAAGLVDDSQQPPHLTVAGMLYLVDDPAVGLGKAYIEVFRYTDASADYDRRDTITGPADIQVERATTRILDELGADLVVLGTFRHELPKLPPVVIREAIANAVAHRQYEMHGSSIRVEIRPDAVTITSPGTLPEPVTIDNIRQAEAARNLAVIKMLRRFGLAEDAGRGVDVMQDEMRGELLDPPMFMEEAHGVTVRLPIGGTVTPRERAWIREIERRGHIRMEDRPLLIHAARGHHLTNSEVRELLGVDSTHARVALRRLRDADLLEQQGKRGGTRYRLRGDLAPPAGLRLDHDDLIEIVLTIVDEQGSATNADIRRRTGLDRADALRLLTELVRTGTLVKRGAKRGTHYVRSDQLDLD